MKHIKDLEVRGHEVIILQDTMTELYAVDIRADNSAGDIIAGYTDFATEDDARYCAMSYLDGVYSILNKLNKTYHDIQAVL